MLGVKRVERVLPVGTALTVVGEVSKFVLLNERSILSDFFLRVNCIQVLAINGLIFLPCLLYTF